jgi:3-hydroxyacyl-CoA dehydrogenase/enoyl-CoA hydratase/3-hydroxybutyryl-CoA epimerase
VNDGSIQIGLPEVQLGVLPGGGGTQRLPRLIGIQNGLQYILEAKRIRPEQALKDGIIHQLVATQAELVPAAINWVLEKGTAKQPWDQDKFKIPGGDVMSPNGAQVFTAGIALLRKKTFGRYPNARYAMSAVYEGLQLPLDKALVVEARYFTKALTSPEAKHMIRTLFFHLNEANKGAARPKDISTIPVQKVGMLGAGMMGAGIAYVTAEAGMTCVLKDVTAEAAQKGKEYALQLWNEKLKKNRMTQADFDSKSAHIIPTDSAAELTGAELIIEAVFEDRSLKANVTREAESVMNPQGVFASNTSTLPITGLAQASARPENFIGLHFFSPVDKMPLVEIIMGKQTSDYALALAIDYVKKIKKTPIVVNDSRGFYTSRVFATYVKEGIALLAEGCPPAMIDNGGKDAGMPVGPLALADEVSLSLLHHIVKQTEEDLGIQINDPAAQVGRLFVEKLDRPGKKAGKGFYEYPEGGKKYLWGGLSEYFPIQDSHPDYETMKMRMLYIQALEAYRCLDEGVLRTPQDGDIGSIFGWGFAPYSGGAISFIDYIGSATFVSNCDALAERFGERFSVPPSLRERAQQGIRFYE